MKQTFDIPRTRTKSSQIDSADRILNAALFAILRVLGIFFLLLVILTFVLFAFTTNGREYIVQFIVFFFTGENALKLLAHVSGMFATILLICLLAVLATLLHPQVRHTLRYDKVLAALRTTLERDPKANVRSEAAKGLAKLDVEESALGEEHEELDDALISTLQGELRDTSPLVRSKAVRGLSNLELEQHSHQPEPKQQLDDILFKI